VTTASIAALAGTDDAIQFNLNGWMLVFAQIIV